MNINGTQAESSDESKRNYRDRRLGKSFSSSVDEGTGYSILSSSDGDRNDLIFADGSNTSALNNEFHDQEQFSSEDIRCRTPVPVGNDEFYEVSGNQIVFQFAQKVQKAYRKINIAV